jgi:hypothetical protein
MTRRHAGLTLVALIAALPALGCINLFRPAEPQPPVGTGGGDQLVVDYSNPASTLQTLANAFEFRTTTAAVNAYMGAFSNPTTDPVPFVVEFDAQVLAGRTPPVWDRDRERLFYQTLFELDSHSYVFRWGTYPDAPIDNIDEAGGQATLYRSYELDADAEEGAVRLAIGHADLDLRKLPNGSWVITRWGDLVDPQYGPDPSDVGNRSFSRLRLDSIASP